MGRIMRQVFTSIALVSGTADVHVASKGPPNFGEFRALPVGAVGAQSGPMFSKRVVLGLAALLVIGACAGAEDATSGTEDQPLAGANGAPVCPSPKVLVCHIPPGNPANAHSICVGQPAVKAHVEHHGDGLGACGGSDAGTPPPPPPPPVPGIDAGPTCKGLNVSCTASSQCCAGMQCAAGENVCVPLIE